MKHGSDYAKRLRRLFNRLVRKYGKPASPEPSDPLEQLLVAILGGNTSHHKALMAFRKLREDMVDLNELRVTPVSELVKFIGPLIPQADVKAQRIVDVLNDIRRRHDTLDLSFLKQRGRREAREYLESLEGVDRHAAASVTLFSLGGHAIPVDELTLQLLRKDEVVDPLAELPEVQSFLEHHISASDATVLTLLLDRYVASRGLRLPEVPAADPVEQVAPQAGPGAVQSAGKEPASASSEKGSDPDGEKRMAASPTGRRDRASKRTKPPRSSPSARQPVKLRARRSAKTAKRR